MEVVVQAPEVTWEQIVATIRVSYIDVYGCTAGHAIAGNPAARPGRAVDVSTLRDVTSVSVCRYDLAEGVLLSGWRLDGDDAARAVRGIAAVPVGGETDRPGDCDAEYAYGEDAVVLRVRSSAGESDVLLRYAGCVGNGFDDGVHRRALGRAWEPFTIGPTRVLALEADVPPSASTTPQPGSS
ncbi:hypothetical protein [Actinoplanes couchii]|uniref:Uncharacterized protein n=1 Tax=Actinoplanes couchii TaxID=403638 RepID=A0ABQ3XDW7_9ACTN|nr:hypothetical protein [Actinoplanes couchii]MDR6317198.1 hypothetical protein [Actinoplanes couchii]GID56691.1 hypothetical protein Aco03nite_050950 [Actinoplanes couchii]